MKTELSKIEKRLQNTQYMNHSDKPKKLGKSSYHIKSATDFSMLTEAEKRRKFEE